MDVGKNGQDEDGGDRHEQERAWRNLKAYERHVVVDGHKAHARRVLSGAQPNMPEDEEESGLQREGGGGEG